MNETIENSKIQIEHYVQVIYDYLIHFGLLLIAAIVILIIGFRLIKLIIKVEDKAIRKSKVDPSLASFLKSLTSISLKVILIIIVASILGIKTTSLVAMVGAATLAIGFALKGGLSNFAGGVILLFLKPFKIGDYITSGSFSGTVNEIQLFYTVLTSPDNKRIVIPNGNLSNNTITNFSYYDTRRIDLSFGIGYEDDIDKAREVIEGLIAKDSRILKDPAPFVAVSELADSSVNFVVRVWANSANYWGIFFDMTENVKKAFDKEKISIPFPQTDVHLIKEK